jgi:hypothetical protein
MELDESKILARIHEIAQIFHVPPQGRSGGIGEKELVDELTFLTMLIKYKK